MRVKCDQRSLTAVCIVVDIVRRWVELEAMIASHQIESRDLRALYSELFCLERLLQSVTSSLNIDLQQFDKIQDVELAIRSIEVNQSVTSSINS